MHFTVNVGYNQKGLFVSQVAQSGAKNIHLKDKNHDFGKMLKNAFLLRGLFLDNAMETTAAEALRKVSIKHFGALSYFLSLLYIHT